MSLTVGLVFDNGGGHDIEALITHLVDEAERCLGATSLVDITSGYGAK